MKTLRASVCLLSFLIAVSGCGYHFSGEGLGPSPNVKRIAIPVFENRTTEPNLGAIVAGALRREFLQKGHMSVVPVEQADAVFEGTVQEIQAVTVAHRFSPTVSDRTSIESRVQLTLDIRCKESRTGKIIWRDPKFTYYKTFPLTEDPLAGFENRQAALEYVAKEMASRIHDRFLSDF
jgi:hypothetical protein